MAGLSYGAAMKRTFLSLLLIAGLSSAALAQAPPTQPPVLVRGTVASFDGTVLTVNGAGGAVTKIALSPETRVSEVSKGDLSALKAGQFVGVAGTPQPDGSQRAISVHIFPPGVKPAEGPPQPYDLGPSSPNSTMTNATVDSISAAQIGSIQGQKMILTYPSGQTTIVITPQTQILTVTPGTKADLTTGAHVVLFARRSPDGSLGANNVNVGMNGLNPAM